MSTIYLPNGGRILCHISWVSTTNDDGSVDYRTNDGKKTFLGTITASGVCHLTNIFSHTYLPPSIDSLQSAYDITKSNLKKLSHYQLRELKAELARFDSRSGYWK